jgi:hypothetical protein
MFDQILDTWRKATESTIQFQQDLYRQWVQVLSVPNPGATSGSGWADQARASQKKWAETLTDLLTKHRETLDTQYRAGIRIIEDAFRVTEAKNPEQFRKLTEELWRQSLDCLKTVSEAQLRNFQAAVEKGIEAVSQGVTATQEGMAAAKEAVSQDVTAAKGGR